METILQKIYAAATTLIIGIGSFFTPTYQENVISSSHLDIYQLEERVSDLESLHQTLGATNPIETPIALFETTLANRIAYDATSMTLTSALTKDGTTLASSTYSFILEEGTANEEFVKADCTGTTCTNMARGLSVLTGTSTVSGAAKDHRRASSVKITTAPILLNITRIINGIGNFPNAIRYDAGITCTTSADICNKGYVDNIVNQGAATSTETNGGIVELGTLAEQASSFDGGSSKPTVLQTKNSTSTCQVLGSYNIVASSTTGKLDKNCLDQSLNYAFTGQNSFSASTTFSATTTIRGSSTSTAPLTINGVPYAFPSANPTSTSTLTNYGTGALSWASPDWSIIGSTTLTGAQATTTLTIPARTDLKVIIQAYAINGASNCGFINFNGDNGANYGYALSDLNSTTVTNVTGDTRTVMKVNTNANANNQSMSVILEISNPASFKKFVSFKTLTEPGGSAQGPNSVTGHGLWNNTSSQITSISFGTGGCSSGGAFTHAAGSRMTVYGSNN